MKVLQRPAVRFRHCSQLVLGFGKSDVETYFSALRSFAKELEGQRRLADAGIAFEEIHSISRQPGIEHFVQSCDARGAQSAIWSLILRHFSPIGFATGGLT